MSTDIVIRTYIKDLPFLVHAVKSIRDRVTGYRNIVITAPRSEAIRIGKVIGLPVIGVQPFADDYIGQQHTKLKATDYSDAEVICFWDSDTVAAHPVDLSDLLFNGDRLIMHHVSFDGLQDGSQIWQQIMARDMGSVPEFEFMRCLPLAYHRSTLIGCVNHIEALHGMQLDAYMKRLPHRSFTEFNCAGMWGHNNERDLYDWRVDEAEVQQWKVLVKQFWSWGGITREIREDLKAMGIT